MQHHCKMQNWQASLLLLRTSCLYSGKCFVLRVPLLVAAVTCVLVFGMISVCTLAKFQIAMQWFPGGWDGGNYLAGDERY